MHYISIIQDSNTMIVKLDKCRNCGILREKTISGECAVCGGRDFVEVQFCELHHAEAFNGLCRYCENEKAHPLPDAQPHPKPTATIETPKSPPASGPKPWSPQYPVPKPKPTPPRPMPTPQPQPQPVPDIKTEKSGLGCWGCLVWPTAIIFFIILLIILLNYIF